MFSDKETSEELEPVAVVLILKHSPVLGSSSFLGVFLRDVGDCSKVKDDSGKRNGDFAGITDPASLAVS